VKLLKHTSLTSKAVTYEIGLADPSYFTKWFKEVSGLHPGEFRRKYQVS